MTSRYTVVLGRDGPEAARARAGGKGAGLSALTRAGSPVPPGFVVTVDAFEALLADADLRNGIRMVFDALGNAGPADPAGIEQASAEIRRLVCGQPVPPEAAQAVTGEYTALCHRLGQTDARSPLHDVPVAVRSSAIAEDLPDASFAGQHDTYLWVRGAEAVLEAVRRCWSSLWTARALAYRVTHGVSESGQAMAVVVQQMVDARTAGAAMTLNPSNGDRMEIVIEAVWGIGEPVVSGAVTPDRYVVDKVLLVPLLSTVGVKPLELVPALDGCGLLRRPLDEIRRKAPCLDHDAVIEVARLAKETERRCGLPQEIEWAFQRDQPGSRGLRLLQSRPETVWSRKSKLRTPVSSNCGVAAIADTLLRLHKPVA